MIFTLAVSAILSIDDREAKDALERFKAAYATNEAAARAAAVADLAATRHELVLARLAALLVADVKEVRVSAARGLGDFSEFRNKAVPALAGALPPNAREPKVQVAILGALGRLGDEKALPGIHGFFENRDAKVAVAALEAVAAIKSHSSYDPLVALLKSLEKTLKSSAPDANGGLVPLPGAGDERTRALAVQAAALKAIQAMTGEKYSTAAEWEIWWARHRPRTGKKRP